MPEIQLTRLGVLEYRLGQPSVYLSRISILGDADFATNLRTTDVHPEQKQQVPIIQEILFGTISFDSAMVLNVDVIKSLLLKT